MASLLSEEPFSVESTIEPFLNGRRSLPLKVSSSISTAQPAAELILSPAKEDV